MPPIKVAAMVGVTALAVVLFVGVAFALSPVQKLEIGQCVNGIKPGATVTATTTRPVDCTTAHDNEVAGSVTYMPDGSFPGQAVVETFAQAPCLDAFRTYVRVDFDSSSLDMILVTPTELTWARGDRLVSCVVLANDGTQLTGSVKGSAK